MWLRITCVNANIVYTFSQKYLVLIYNNKVEFSHFSCCHFITPISKIRHMSTSEKTFGKFCFRFVFILFLLFVLMSPFLISFLISKDLMNIWTRPINLKGFHLITPHSVASMAFLLWIFPNPSNVSVMVIIYLALFSSIHQNRKWS